MVSELEKLCTIRETIDIDKPIAAMLVTRVMRTEFVCVWSRARCGTGEERMMVIVKWPQNMGHILDSHWSVRLILASDWWSRAHVTR